MHFFFHFKQCADGAATKAGHRQKEVINQANGKLINGVIFFFEAHRILGHCDTKLSKLSHYLSVCARVCVHTCVRMCSLAQLWMLAHSVLLTDELGDSLSH